MSLFLCSLLYSSLASPLFRFWGSVKVTDLPFPFSSPGRGFLVVSAIQRIINSSKPVKKTTTPRSLVHSFIFPSTFLGDACNDNRPKIPAPTGFSAIAMFPGNVWCIEQFDSVPLDLVLLQGVLVKKSNFCHLSQQPYSFDHYSRLMTLSKFKNTDLLVNLKRSSCFSTINQSQLTWCFCQFIFSPLVKDPKIYKHLSLTTKVSMQLFSRREPWPWTEGASSPPHWTTQ